MSMSLKTVQTGFAQVLQPAVAQPGRSGLRLMPRGVTEVGRKLTLAPRNQSRSQATASGTCSAAGLIPSAADDRAESILFATIVGLSVAAVALGMWGSVEFADNWANVTRAVSALIG